MSNLNKLILPVKNQSSGEVTNQEFNLSSSGGSTLSKLILPVKNESSGEITNQEFSLPSGGGGSGTPITPSNSSPVSMTGGETYTPTTNGVAVESVTDITPSNSNPPALSSGNIYKPVSSAYAITSYTNITPSSSGTYFSSGMKKMSSSGYAYSSQPAIISGGELATTSTSGSNPNWTNTINSTNGEYYVFHIQYGTATYKGVTYEGCEAVMPLTVYYSGGGYAFCLGVVKATSSSAKIKIKSQYNTRFAAVHIK